MKVGTEERPTILGTEGLPDRIVNQELKITITQKRGDDPDPRRGLFQCDVLFDGERKWMSPEDYEYLCRSLDAAKDYFERNYTISGFENS